MKKQAFKIIGLSIRTTNQDNQATKDILNLWQEFLSEDVVNQIPNKLSLEIYSIYTDYEGDHMAPYTVILGCKVDSLDKIPDGMIGREIPEGNYIKRTVVGNLKEGVIFEEWQDIWDSDLERVYSADYEVYGEKAQNPEDAEVDIFIAVK